MDADAFDDVWAEYWSRHKANKGNKLGRRSDDEVEQQEGAGDDCNSYEGDDAPVLFGDDLVERVGV